MSASRPARIEPNTVPQMEEEIVRPKTPGDGLNWCRRLSVAAERAPRSYPKTNPPSEPMYAAVMSRLLSNIPQLLITRSSHRESIESPQTAPFNLDRAEPNRIVFNANRQRCLLC